MDTGIKKQVLDEILMAAEKNNIEKVILFGSRARGDYRKTSDIDLAVSGGRIAHFQADIEEEVSHFSHLTSSIWTGVCQEELVDSIKREGKVLYEKI